MSQSARPWTDEERAYVEAHYLTATHAEIGEAIGRSRHAVRNLCWEQGWHKRTPWTPEEDEKLRSLYAGADVNLFLDSMAEQFGRTRAAVACRANELGITVPLRQTGDGPGRRPAAKETVVKAMNAPSRFTATRNGLGASTSGGYREDLGFYVRSTWEANYARYLKWLAALGEVVEWAYEPDTFEFPVKRGTRFYTPDFWVLWRDGRTEYHEVKGYMDQRSRTRLDRMGRYYPEVTVVVVGRDEYRRIRRDVGRIVPGWVDADGKVPRSWGPEQETRLRALWEAGASRAEIAGALGRSENAVALRAQRRGYQRPANRPMEER